MLLEKAQHAVAVYVTRIFGLFPRLRFVLLAVAMSLTTGAAVLAQQSAQTGTRAPIAT